MTDLQSKVESYQYIFQICEQKFLITQWAAEQGHITEQIRYRINENFLQEVLSVPNSAITQILKHANLELPRTRMKEPCSSQNTIINISVANKGNQAVQARDITGSSIVTGDHNTVSTTTKQVALTPADQIDVMAELVAMRGLLAELKRVPERGKLDRAVADAVEETAKPEPDREEVGGAVERAVKYAKAADDFGEHAEKLLPRLAALASWLGPAGHALLSTLRIGP
jgi:hypothetical protein